MQPQAACNTTKSRSPRAAGLITLSMFRRVVECTTVCGVGHDEALYFWGNAIHLNIQMLVYCIAPRVYRAAVGCCLLSLCTYLLKLHNVHAHACIHIQFVNCLLRVAACYICVEAPWTVLFIAAFFDCKLLLTMSLYVHDTRRTSACKHSKRASPPVVRKCSLAVSVIVLHEWKQLSSSACRVETLVDRHPGASLCYVPLANKRSDTVDNIQVTERCIAWCTPCYVRALQQTFSTGFRRVLDSNALRMWEDVRQSSAACSGGAVRTRVLGMRIDSSNRMAHVMYCMAIT